MIKLKVRHLNSELFHSAITKLTKSAAFADFKSSYNMAKIARKISNETRTAHELFTKEIGAFYMLDDKGQVIPATPEESKITGAMWKVKEDKLQDYVAKLNQMLDVDVEIGCYPLDPETIITNGITPQEALVLEPIFAVVDQPES